MFIKIFLSILLLTYVYTYMLKSIKDNNNTNFQKSHDNFIFKLNENRTVKLSLSGRKYDTNILFRIVFL